MIHQRFITEIRYTPDPAFLDKRGAIVKKLLSENFKDWKIDTNRVELSNKDGMFFISFSNLGFITTKAEKLDTFIEAIDNALKFLGDVPPTRWGTRIQTLTPSNKRFGTLVDNYKQKSLNFNQNQFNRLGTKLTDLGVSYIFEKDHNSYHLSSGPMRKTQAVEIFDNKNLPQNGIMVDLDIYRKDRQFYGADYRRERIMSFVKQAYSDGQLIIKDFIGELK